MWTIIRSLIAAAVVQSLLATAAVAGEFVSQPVGGSGGTGYTMTCDDDAVLVGVFAKSGSWIDSLGIICRRLKSDGSLGDTFTKGPVGGSGGLVYANPQCPAGQVVHDVYFSAGSFVNMVDFFCGAWSAKTLRVAAPNDDLPDGHVGKSTLLSGDSRVLCVPDGLPAKGFRGKQGTYVDSISLVCDDAIPPLPSPVFTVMPGVVQLPAATGGSVSITVSGKSPVSVTLTAPSAYASYFELLTPAPSGGKTSTPVTVPPGTMVSVTRLVRFKGGLKLTTVGGSTIPVNIPLTLTAKDGQGNTLSRILVVSAY